jgi:quercetin dioxygenase-like cupin family protein
MTIPNDDLARQMTMVDGGDPILPHVAVVGDTYTILVSGANTNSRYCLIDMLVADGGGPAPHRHDFEEMFTVLEGEIEITFRGKKQLAKAGGIVNIPANAPHGFKNVSGRPARMLCMCSPAGQDEFFLKIGTLVASRTTPAPKMTGDEQKAFITKAQELAPHYATELLPPEK